MIHFLLLLNLLMVLQTSALKLSSSFRITSSSPFDKVSNPEQIEIKGYLWEGFSAYGTSEAYETVLQLLEKGARDLCANSVVEFTWKRYEWETGRDRKQISLHGAGTAVCDKSLFASNQTKCSCS